MSCLFQAGFSYLRSSRSPLTACLQPSLSTSPSTSPSLTTPISHPFSPPSVSSNLPSSSQRLVLPPIKAWWFHILSPLALDLTLRLFKLLTQSVRPGQTPRMHITALLVLLPLTSTSFRTKGPSRSERASRNVSSGRTGGVNWRRSWTFRQGLWQRHNTTIAVMAIIHPYRMVHSITGCHSRAS